MSIDVDIEPDPSRPLGGYARVLLPAGALARGEVSLTIYEMFKERYLGQDGWQPTKAAFGPYPVETTPTGQRFVIGPEIVNHLSEFAPVRLGFGDAEVEVTWPDTVAVAPNAPPIGSVIGPTPKPEVLEGPYGGDDDARDDDTGEGGFDDAGGSGGPEPGTEDGLGADEPGPGSGGAGGTTTGGLSRGVLLLVGGLVLALAAGGYYYWSTLAPVPVVDPEPEPDGELVVEPEPAPDPCAAETLRGSEEGFSTRLETLRGCAGSASPETALDILEAGVAEGDAEALLLFGHIYNPGVTDEDIEGAVGLSFGDNLAVAIDYYSRAGDAGSESAVEALSQACDSLRAVDPAAAEDLCE